MFHQTWLGQRNSQGCLMTPSWGHSSAFFGMNHSLILYDPIWVCLKMVYTPNYSHLVGIMIINHWVWGYTSFRHTHMGIYDPNHLFERISIRITLMIAIWITPCQLLFFHSIIHIDSPRNDHDDPLIAMIFDQAAPKETAGASVGHSYPGGGGRH